MGVKQILLHGRTTDEQHEDDDAEPWFKGDPTTRNRPLPERLRSDTEEP